MIDTLSFDLVGQITRAEQPVAELLAVVESMACRVNQLPGEVDARLEPQLTAMMALMTLIQAALAPAALVPAPLSAWATDDEIDDIRRRAEHLCHERGYRMRALWGEYQRRYYLPKSRRTFGRIPRRAVQAIIDDLEARLTDELETPTRILPKRVPRPCRAADPKTDLDTVQVSEMLGREGFAVAPALLSSAFGLYDTLDIKPLYCPGRSPKSGSKEPYLDRMRVHLLLDWFKNHARSVDCILTYVREVPLEDRQDMKEGRPIRRKRLATLFHGA